MNAEVIDCGGEVVHLFVVVIVVGLDGGLEGVDAKFVAFFAMLKVIL